MITLQNLGDSILFTFDENDKYLNNGTISVPMNSLILVTDESEMATFRKAASNDIFVSALYSDFGMTKAELEEWYAENMVSEVTEEDVDEKIAEAVGEETDRAVSAETALSGAIDAIDAAYKAADSVISGAVDNLSSALQNESQRAQNAESALSGAIDTKIDESAITSAITSASTNSEIPSAKAVYDALQESGLDEDTERLISGSLNDLNERKLDASAYTPTDLTNYYTKSETSGATEIATALNAKADTATTYTKSETDNAITAATSTKQDTLVSGTNIKTINNESILGSGNIDIQGGGKAVSAGTNISITSGETADTINCTLPISAGTNGYGIIFDEYSTASGGGIACGRANAAQRSIAFGYSASATSTDSIAVGQYNSVQRNSGFALGFKNIVSTYGIGALGSNLISNAQSEVACGQFNISRGSNYNFGASDNTLFSVGNGSSDSGRHNAFEIRGNGDIYIADTNDASTTIYYQKPMIKLQDALGGTVDTEITSASTNPVTSAAIYNQFGGLKLVKISQAAYDALENKDANTLYIIVNEPPFNGKWKATYQDGHVTSAECGSSSEISQNEIDNTNLVSLEIGDCVTSIGAGAFYSCTSLTSCTISNGVTTISDQSFYGCTSLTNCTIGSGVTTISDGAFINCTSLTSITVKATTPPTLIGYGTSPFDNTNNCPIYVPAASVDAYKAASGWSGYASRIQAIS